MADLSSFEALLSKIKIPLPDMLNAILALDDSAMDIDQIENLIKICQSKQEIRKLKKRAGDDEKERLGKFDELFAELRKVQRIELKLRAFGFKIAYPSKVEDIRSCLNTINDATKEMMGSATFRQIMQTIATQENLEGSDVRFELDSLVKLSDDMALMHDFCKLVYEKMPELLDFGNELVHVEAASKIEFQTVYGNMRALKRGLRKMDQEYISSLDDGEISAGFRNVVNDFLNAAEAESKVLTGYYTETGNTISSNFSEGVSRFGFHQVTKTLTHFIKTFNNSREEIERQAEAGEKILRKKQRTSNKTMTSNEPNLNP